MKWCRLLGQRRPQGIWPRSPKEVGLLQQVQASLSPWAWVVLCILTEFRLKPQPADPMGGAEKNSSQYVSKVMMMDSPRPRQCFGLRKSLGLTLMAWKWVSKGLEVSELLAKWVSNPKYLPCIRLPGWIEVITGLMNTPQINGELKQLTSTELSYWEGELRPSVSTELNSFSQDFPVQKV